MEIYDHLLSRGFFTGNYIGCNLDRECATFFLYNLSGQLVGFQVYRPTADKNWRLDPKEQRYFTHMSPGQIGVWGLESYRSATLPLFLVEGVFEACRLHNFGLQCVAILGCNPEHLRNWLWSLPNPKICICQGDKAGKLLETYGDKVIQLADNTDVGDITDTELKLLLKEYL